ncbi:hypothetical protein EDI_066140 [Entamoeba dispar SAW760]|uniref:Uncharacterized protein n=1 Tax=Entamoeba dispar (strain ATCC PRA-260 / SAW760) TaxID=370354 RepID=B0EUN0_ENTDS|nr:uncharacterized protein EDI_066140 [Entamoeba dispar SAW760]EDR21769.1 hypothetical protein EDI_066140 [Entamoeba dispar SAW760]|eukprot:EDR21769.1 hypothetical protein EDI_066140 [Entamoeba dispar SAW760]
MIEKAKPLIDTAVDFIPGGNIIKKGTEIMNKLAEPTSEALNRIASGENVIGTTKRYLNEIKNEIPNDITKTASNIINQIPERKSIKRKRKPLLFANRLNNEEVNDNIIDEIDEEDEVDEVDDYL